MSSRAVSMVLAHTFTGLHTKQLKHCERGPSLLEDTATLSLTVYSVLVIRKVWHAFLLGLPPVLITQAIGVMLL